MEFKPFAVHYNIGRRKTDNARIKSRPIGFTAWIEPGPDKTVNCRITHCAYHDDFNKKKGREIAQMQPDNFINPRDVPEYLVACLLYTSDAADE